MSNIYPSCELRVPSEEDERPVYQLRGIIFKTPMRHCRPRHLWPKDVAELSTEWFNSIALYLANFVEPVRTIADEIRCPSCDAQVTGHHVLLADYRYRQNLTYSTEGTMEGRCAGCGYPCRLRHDVYLIGTPKLLVGLRGFPLFYHPSATQRIN